MIYTDSQLSSLRARVKEVLGEKRYLHTLGVERAAQRLGMEICPDDTSELRCAALLHDITKELPESEQLGIMKKAGIVGASDIISIPVHHSLTAPYVIERDFPDYATERVLSAIRRHTTGDVGMSIFDEIIFIADYIEDGRTYESCVSLREELYGALAAAESSFDKEYALHKAVLAALDNTITSLIKRGTVIHERTVFARNYILGVLIEDFD